MSTTITRQDTEIRNSDTYDDTVTPSAANFETIPTNIEMDLNNVRSMLSYLKDIQAGNWSDQFIVPSTFENGNARGVDNLNQDLHDFERKRILDFVHEIGKDVSVGAGANFVVLGVGELPTSAVINTAGGNTLGALAAFHTGGFGSHSLDVIAGPNAVEPISRALITDGNTGKPIESSGREILGLLQFENNVDPGTSSTSAPNRLQISFVRPNASFDGLEACPFADIENRTINYAYIQQFAFQDLPRHAFLGAQIGEGSGATSVNRQVSYDNQGTAPVSLLTNATLDLKSSGQTWKIRDIPGGDLFSITENSGTAASTARFGSDVDVLDVDAAVIDFAQGVTVGTSLARPISIGVTDGHIKTTAGQLELEAATIMAFDDGNKPGSWVTPAGIPFSLTQPEWDAYKVAFGEVSVLNALVQAAGTGGGGGGTIRGTKTYAVVTADTGPNIDIGGSGGGANLTVQLPDLSVGSFFDHDYYVNGRLQRGGADASANFDYYPGSSIALGQVKFEKTLKIGDVVCAVTWT